MFRSAVMKQSQGGKHMNEKSLHDTTNILTDPAPCTRNGIGATVETSSTSPMSGRVFNSDMLHSLRNDFEAIAGGGSETSVAIDKTS